MHPIELTLVESFHVSQCFFMQLIQCNGDAEIVVWSYGRYFLNGWQVLDLKTQWVVCCLREFYIQISVSP